MNDLIALLNGKGMTDPGIKGLVDRHERVLGFIAKIAIPVSSALLVSTILFSASTLAFVFSARQARAEMHEISSTR